MVIHSHRTSLTGLAFLPVLLAWSTLVQCDSFFSSDWTFDSPAGYQFDASKIEVTGGVARLKSISIPTGLALTLNGIDQHAQISESAQTGLDLGTDDFLFAAWIRVEGANQFQGIFQKLGNASPYAGFYFHLEDLGAQSYRLRSFLTTQSGQVREFKADEAIKDGSWHQVAVAVDRTNGVLRYFLDGSAFGPVFGIGDIQGSIANDGPVKIGHNDYVGLGRLAGSIDEAYLWSFQGGLPADLESLVRAHRNHNLASSQNVVSAWKFDDGAGTDSVGSNSLTFINGPTTVEGNIQIRADDAPAIQSACVAGGGQSLYSAEDARATGGAGELRYQLSTDGVGWLYFDTPTGWTSAQADVNHSSLLYQLKENLPDFPGAASTLCLRAFLVSNGVYPVALDRFAVVPPPSQLTLVNELAATRPSPGGFRVIFETDFPAEAYLEYRRHQEGTPDPWLATGATSGGTVFGLDASGLGASTSYDYQVRYRPRGTSLSFQTSLPGRVSTAPVDGASAQMVFAVWGDSRPPGGNTVQPPIFSQLLGMMAADGPVFHVAVGDNVDFGGAIPFTQEKAFALYGGWRDAYDVAGAYGHMFFGLGNHDGEGLAEPLRSTATLARLRATAQPLNGNEAQRYYSWRWGDALFIMLDGSGPTSIDAAQEAWLLARLGESAKWKFVFNHYPIFNSSRRISDAALRDRLHAAFVQNGVQIVFQAHDHWYADTVVDSIHYTTSGGAGSPLATANQLFGEISKYHYLQASLSPTSVNIRAIQVSTGNDNGTVLHSYCVPAPGLVADLDGDGQPDSCDADIDGDGVANGADNCPEAANPGQTDFDNDSHGNVCDPEETVLISVGSQDGWVLESGENTNVGGNRSVTMTGKDALRFGDATQDRQYKAIISFNTANLPANIMVDAARLELSFGANTGNNPPYATFGTAWLDLASGGFNGSPALEAADFQASATVPNSASLSNAGALASANLNAAGLAQIDGAATIQIRIAFARDDNDDSKNDYAGYYSGENATPARRPRLIIQYRRPD